MKGPNEPRFPATPDMSRDDGSSDRFSERFSEDPECHLLDLGNEPPGEGVSVLLCDPHETFEANPKALFLGPKAENAELVERMLLDVFRDYGFWRRNFHPEDRPVITPQDQDRRAFKNFWSHFQQQLQILLGELKADVPFYSPRYIGHMTTDNCLPAVVATIATLLYNPNNVSWEAAPVTSLLEVQVGRDLAKMVGFGATSAELEGTWGHITSGGTLANLESLWVAKAVKFLPVAVRSAAREKGLEGLLPGPCGKPLDQMTAWELSNLSPRQALDLKDSFIETYARTVEGPDPLHATKKAVQALKKHEILTLGDHTFFSRLTGDDVVHAPLIVVPQTMHYSWVKAAGAIGIGSGQIVVIPIDSDFRMQPKALEEALTRALHERRPVIQVVTVGGTTEEGAVDPIHLIAKVRDEMAARGLTFSLHCDAAYGGYFASAFRPAGGGFRSLADMQNEYAGWPSRDVYDSFEALGQVDSITIDPHKLGYVPYPAGAIVFREGRSKELVAQQAPYALGGRPLKAGPEINIGKYILEGSKPGASAAAVFLCHRVLPLDERGYGKLLGLTVRSARSFYRRLREFSERVKADVLIHPLVFPDTNIINYLMNPAENRRLDIMNQFAHALYRELSLDTQSPIQTRSFMVSHTEFSYDSYNPDVIRSVLSERFGIEGHYFTSEDEVMRNRAAGMEGYDHELVVFRATLMNPFVMENVVGSKDYIDLFLEKLAQLLKRYVKPK